MLLCDVGDLQDENIPYQGILAKMRNTDPDEDPERICWNLEDLDQDLLISHLSKWSSSYVSAFKWTTQLLLVRNGRVEDANLDPSNIAPTYQAHLRGGVPMMEARQAEQGVILGLDLAPDEEAAIEHLHDTVNYWVDKRRAIAFGPPPPRSTIMDVLDGKEDMLALCESYEWPFKGSVMAYRVVQCFRWPKSPSNLLAEVRASVHQREEFTLSPN